MDIHLLRVDSPEDGEIGSFGLEAAAGRVGLNAGDGFEIPTAFPNSFFPRRSIGPKY